MYKARYQGSVTLSSLPGFRGNPSKLCDLDIRCRQVLVRIHGADGANSGGPEVYFQLSYVRRGLQFAQGGHMEVPRGGFAVPHRAKVRGRIELCKL